MGEKQCQASPGAIHTEKGCGLLLGGLRYGRSGCSSIKESEKMHREKRGPSGTQRALVTVFSCWPQREAYDDSEDGNNLHSENSAHTIHHAVHTKAHLIRLHGRRGSSRSSQPPEQPPDVNNFTLPGTWRLSPSSYFL